MTRVSYSHPTGWQAAKALDLSRLHFSLDRHQCRHQPSLLRSIRDLAFSLFGLPPPPLPPPRFPVRAAAAQPPIPELQFVERLQHHQSCAEAHPPDVPKPLCAAASCIILRRQLQQCGAEAEILLDVAGISAPGAVRSTPPSLCLPGQALTGHIVWWRQRPGIVG